MLIVRCGHIGGLNGDSDSFLHGRLYVSRKIVQPVVEIIFPLLLTVGLSMMSMIYRLENLDVKTSLGSLGFLTTIMYLYVIKVSSYQNHPRVPLSPPNSGGCCCVVVSYMPMPVFHPQPQPTYASLFYVSPTWASRLPASNGCHICHAILSHLRLL